MKEVELSTSVTNRKKVRLVLFFSVFFPSTYTFFCHSFQYKEKGSSSRLNLLYQHFFLLLFEEHAVAKVGNDYKKARKKILLLVFVFSHRHKNFWKII